MQTLLTLQTGSFFFLESISLIRGLPVQVDFSTLPAKEVKTLKHFILSGQITADVDQDKLLKALEVAETVETVGTPKPVVVEETQEEEVVDYEKMTNKQLKAEVAKRGIETKLTSNKDLVALLKEDDAEAAG